jgi:hypothetical protein
MDFKKKCINFKKNAKEFGYDLKLTHVQELLAKYEGYENRHALLSSLKSKVNESTSNSNPEYYYFDIHVFFGVDEGYSIGYRSKKPYKINGEIDDGALLVDLEKLNLFVDKEDISSVDYIADITEDEWKDLTSYNDNKLECYTCKQLYNPEDVKSTNPDRKDVVCKNCYSNEVKMFISTDDNYFNHVETYIDTEYLDWAINDNRGFIEMLIDGYYGPDSHTDQLLFDTNSPTAKQIANYIESVNSVRKNNDLIGYSISVDEDSFKKWLKENRSRLTYKGFLL